MATAESIATLPKTDEIHNALGHMIAASATLRLLGSELEGENIPPTGSAEMLHMHATNLYSAWETLASCFE